MRPVLVLDLDGTLALGATPVLGYARAIESSAPQADGLTVAVEAFLEDPQADGRLRSAQDGYQAVAMLCESLGVDATLRDRAYSRSREALDADLGDVRAPLGLSEALADLDVHRVLVTNSPREGLDTLLGHVGVAGLVDEVHTQARKPTGMGPLLTELLHTHGLVSEPARLMSVGDIWVNDLAPALELGCATAYVDTFDRRQGPAHVRARTLPELYPALREWARHPVEFVHAHPLPAGLAVGAGTERPGPES